MLIIDELLFTLNKIKEKNKKD